MDAVLKCYQKCWSTSRFGSQASSSSYYDVAAITKLRSKGSVLPSTFTDNRQLPGI